MLPNADLAIIPRSKIEGYLLNRAHPEGGPKARFFRAHGYHEGAAETLARDLRQLAASGTVTATSESVFGIKYVVEGRVTTPRETRVYLRTVWIVEAGEERPHLVTAYPTSPPATDHERSDDP